jgi:DNA-binding NtrC family response regulator
MKQELTEYRAANGIEPPARRKVLLIDDDMTDLERHFSVLQGEGLEVLSCSSYENGAALVERGDFDLVLVSQGSPAFEGRIVVERAAAVGRRIPVLVLARCKDMKCYVEAMQLGAADYLEKPVSPMEMKRVISAMRGHGCLPEL